MQRADTPAAPATILVAWDGSPAAAAALPLARAVARRLEASVEVVHVAPPGEAERAAQALQPLLAPEERLHARAASEPARAILEAAADPAVTLLALTTHGGPPGAERRLGRVAQAVLARVRRPVLLVPPEVAERAGEIALEHLLVPFDGSSGTAVALAPAMELAHRLGASVDLLYVAGPEVAVAEEPECLAAPRYVDQPHHEWPQWASEMLARVKAYLAPPPEGLQVRVYLARGDVVAEVLRFATERREDGIVLARRSRLEPGRARVLREVVARAPCPVLLVGSPAELTRR